MTGVSGCRATGSRDYATARPRDHAMAHVRRVVSVACEATPEVVELVDILERLAFHGDIGPTTTESHNIPNTELNCCASA